MFIYIYIFSFLRQSTLQCYRGTVECIFSCIYFCEHIITHYYRKKNDWLPSCIFSNLCWFTFLATYPWKKCNELENENKDGNIEKQWNWLNIESDCEVCRGINRKKTSYRIIRVYLFFIVEFHILTFSLTFLLF